MNIITTLIDIMGDIYNFLLNNEFADIPLLYYGVAIIITNMAISIFWKGAHG